LPHSTAGKPDGNKALFYVPDLKLFESLYGDLTRSIYNIHKTYAGQRLSNCFYSIYLAAPNMFAGLAQATYKI